MPDVIKIKNVHVYTVMNEHAKECWDVLKLLQDNEIEFINLHYVNSKEMNDVISSLNTWTFSADAVNNFQRTFTKFPIIHWETIDDNYDKFMNVAEGFDELQASPLIANKDKVLKREV